MPLDDATYQVLKDFTGPVVTGLAALVAAGVTGTFAYRQAETARLQAQIALDKLKYDTFEARHDVLNAARALLDAVLNRPALEDYNRAAMVDLRRRIAHGRFYFGATVTAYLNRLVDDCYELMDAVEDADVREDLAPPTDETKREIRRLRANVRAHYQDCPRLLERDLSLNFLKAGSDREHRTVKGVSLPSVVILLVALIAALFLTLLASLGVL